VMFDLNIEGGSSSIYLAETGACSLLCTRADVLIGGTFEFRIGNLGTDSYYLCYVWRDCGYFVRQQLKISEQSESVCLLILKIFE